MPKIKPEELKASILQYAIEGKLVEQRAEEGTAEELYKQIRAEKQKLIKEGKIKKEKPLPEISEDEIPFDIPESWKWVRLGDCGCFERGNGIKKDEVTKEGKPCIRYGQLYTTYKTRFSQAVSYISPELFEKCHKAYKNDILMALTGENEYDIALAVTYEGDEQIAIGGDMTRFFNHNMDPLYLTYVINSRHGILCKSKMASGNIIVHISNDKLATIPIPLPPLAEQRRIVAKIEELLPYVDRYAEAYEKLEEFNAKFPDEMKKSILQYAIEGRLVEQRAEEGTAEELYKQIRAEKQKLIKEGKIKKEKPLPEISEDEIPFDIPESWKWVRLASLLTVRGGRRIPAGRKLTKIPTSRVYIRVTDMQNGTISNNDLYYVPEDIIDEISNYIITKEDIYIVIVGSTIGKCGLVPEEFSGMNLTENAARLTPYFVDKTYLYKVLSSTFMQNQFIDKTYQVGVPKLAITRLETSLFPLPPLAEQRRIVARIEELLPLCERLAECREKA